jgi:hypothetical protein
LFQQRCYNNNYHNYTLFVKRWVFRLLAAREVAGAVMGRVDVREGGVAGGDWSGTKAALTVRHLKGEEQGNNGYDYKYGCQLFFLALCMPDAYMMTCGGERSALFLIRQGGKCIIA